jgi:hypothetical protein
VIRVSVEVLRLQPPELAYMEEILARRYAAGEGLGPGGSQPSNRAAFETVNHYHGWKASPPRDRSGQALSGFSGWEREVTVEWIDPAHPQQVVGSDQGGMRVTVTVRRNGDVVALLQAVRTDHESTGTQP